MCPAGFRIGVEDLNHPAGRRFHDFPQGFPGRCQQVTPWTRARFRFARLFDRTLYQPRWPCRFRLFWIYSGYTPETRNEQAFSETRNRQFPKSAGPKGAGPFRGDRSRFDRELVRTVARRLAEGGPDFERLRAAVKKNIGSPRRAAYSRRCCPRPSSASNST